MENAAKDIQKLSNGGNNSIQMDEDVSKKARHQSEIQRLIEQSELNMDEEQHLTYEIESVKDFLSKTLQVRGGKEDRPQLKDVSSNPSTDMYGARPSGFAL